MEACSIPLCPAKPQANGLCVIHAFAVRAKGVDFYLACDKCGRSVKDGEFIFKKYGEKARHVSCPRQHKTPSLSQRRKEPKPLLEMDGEERRS